MKFFSFEMKMRGGEGDEGTYEARFLEFREGGERNVLRWQGKIIKI